MRLLSVMDDVMMDGKSEAEKLVNFYVRRPEGVLFLYREKYDQWSLPGGKVKVQIGETEEGALLRETEEETGYDIGFRWQVKSFRTIGGGKEQVVHHVDPLILGTYLLEQDGRKFHRTIYAGDFLGGNPRLSDEHQDMRLIPSADYAYYGFEPNTMKLLKELDVQDRVRDILNELYPGEYNEKSDDRVLYFTHDPLDGSNDFRSLPSILIANYEGHQRIDVNLRRSAEDAYELAQSIVEKLPFECTIDDQVGYGGIDRFKIFYDQIQ